jgi:hydroxymethylbilane synthase
MNAPALAPALRLATRRSALALAQSRTIGEQLSELTGRPLELIEVVTRGDVDTAPLAQIGGTGVFVAAVREAVADGRADLAVHSLKDLPTAADPRLTLAAIPRREDPRDALVSRTGCALADLPAGSRVGTGSPRRRAQLAAARPDVELVEMRGNVDTRLARVHGAAGDDSASGADLDAVVLAVAGLTRLGRAARIDQHLDPELVMPAPGQGALAVEVSADLAGAGTAEAVALSDALRSIDDPGTRAAVTAERTLLAALEAGCSAPVGALALVDGEGPEATMHLRAVLARTDGSLVRMSTTGPAGDAADVGRRLAADLLAESHPVTAAGTSAATPHPTLDQGSTTR